MHIGLLLHIGTFLKIKKSWILYMVQSANIIISLGEVLNVLEYKECFFFADLSNGIENFSYDNGTNYLDIITEYLKQTNFLGISVSGYFSYGLYKSVCV